MLKCNITCPGCHRRYSVEVPNDAGTHPVCCPYCSAPYSVTVQRSVKDRSVPVTDSEFVARKVRRCELFSGIAWLIIGVVQCIAVYTAAAGVWNIINAFIRLRSSRNVTSGNASVVTYFDERRVWLIVMAVVNLVLGGVLGVFLVAFDWYVRDFVLRNRSAFEG